MNWGINMKFIKFRFLFILLTLFIVNERGFGFEKVGTTSFQFLKVMTGARGTALGEAYSSVVANSDAVFFNPAGLTSVTNIDISADYLDWFLDISHMSFAAAYHLPEIGTIGLQGTFTDVGEIRETTVAELNFDDDGIYRGYTGRILNPTAMVLGISYARRLTDKFSFGITAKYAREDLVVESTDNIMFDAGLTYETGFKSLKVSAVIRHFGPEVRYYDNVNIRIDSTTTQKYRGKSYPLPQTFNIGIAGYIMSADENLFLHSDNQSLLIAFDMVQPRDYDQQYNVGIEYGFENILFLRGGYKLNYDEESFSLGVGVNYSNYRIDYAFSDFGDYLDSVHRFSFGLSLD